MQKDFVAKPFPFVVAVAYSQLFCGCSVNVFSPSD